MKHTVFSGYLPGVSTVTCVQWLAQCTGRSV